MNTKTYAEQALLDNSTVIVFGGAGFIGTHLMRRLKNGGAHRVISVDIRTATDPVEGVEYFNGDVRDLGSLQFDQDIPVIFNLAAVHTTPGHEPWEYYDTNIQGAIEITRLAARHKTKKMIFTSSISVYGPDEDAKDETSKPAPTSDYGRSKLMAESIHEEWLIKSDVRQLVIVRPAVVFGKGEGGNFTRLAKMLRKGFFVYPGRRDTIKSCIYVGDLVTWMLAAAAQNKSFILFNGSFSNRYTIKEIVNTFREVAFPKAKSFMVPAFVLKAVAAAMRPLSASGLGIHPDRIHKLMVSTNILPTWAESEGLETTDRLRNGLSEWKADSDGDFV
jgi:nucleoside-diphosphate-sugar epimerase